MRSALSELCRAYDAAFHAWLAELANDINPAKEQALDDAFTALRDQIFDYRPASLEEMVEKATFLSTRWDQAEGLNRHRVQQLFTGFGAALVEPPLIGQH